MPKAFLLSWSGDRCSALKRRGELGKPIEVLYGSPHTSAPSLHRYQVGPGDIVYIVAMRSGELFLVTRLVIREIVCVKEYLRRLGVSEAILALHLFDLEEQLKTLRPELGHRLPFGCVDEAALPSVSTPARLDLQIPSAALQRLVFRTMRGIERGLALREGKMAKPSTLNGHFFRLTEASAAVLEAVATGTPLP